LDFLSVSNAGLQNGESDGIDFRVDARPPVQVAFLQPGGIIDNWEGVVWDQGRAARLVTSAACALTPMPSPKYTTPTISAAAVVH